MGRGLRHAFTVVALVVALMSGILSLMREFLLFQYPNRFQEAPLFWACLRIAFGISLIFLWYEERQQRLALEKQLQKPPEKPPSLKAQTLALSTSILEFIYARSEATPKIASIPRYPTIEGTAAWLQKMEDYNQELRAQRNYEQATLGMYDYRYKRSVAEAIVSLKNLGQDTSVLERCASDLLNESEPEDTGNPRVSILIHEWIKVVGKNLGALADQIKNA
jgi:hypothetical protein